MPCRSGFVAHRAQTKDGCLVQSQTTIHKCPLPGTRPNCQRIVVMSALRWCEADVMYSFGAFQLLRTLLKKLRRAHEQITKASWRSARAPLSLDHWQDGVAGTSVRTPEYPDRLLAKLVHLSLMSRRLRHIGVIAAQFVVFGDLLRCQQRPLGQMSLQVN